MMDHVMGSRGNQGRSDRIDAIVGGPSNSHSNFGAHNAHSDVSRLPVNVAGRPHQGPIVHLSTNAPLGRQAEIQS